jgi:hypothetical protein
VGANVVGVILNAVSMRRGGHYYYYYYYREYYGINEGRRKRRRKKGILRSLRWLSGEEPQRRKVSSRAMTERAEQRD